MRTFACSRVLNFARFARCIPQRHHGWKLQMAATALGLDELQSSSRRKTTENCTILSQDVLRDPKGPSLLCNLFHLFTTLDLDLFAAFVAFCQALWIAQCFTHILGRLHMYILHANVDLHEFLLQVLRL